MSGPIWPNFFVVGAPKAGTTAISTALMKHPEVFPCIVKEPNFFNSDIYLEDFLGPPRFDGKYPPRSQHYAVIRDQELYLRLYRNADGFKAIGDYSAQYLRSKIAADAIYEKVPAAKIVICLRDPVDRAFSHFLMDCRIGRVNVPFASVIRQHAAELALERASYENYIRLGLYSEQVKRFLDRFGSGNTLVILYDDLRADPQDVMQRIFHHIGVAENVDVKVGTENGAALARAKLLNRFLYKSGLKRFIVHHVPSKIKRASKKYYYRHTPNQIMADADRAALADIFREEVRELSAILRRDLRHWL